MTKREQNYMATILEAVDQDDLALPDMWQVLRYGIDFSAYIIAVNRLVSLKLIEVDANHVARRVRT